MHHTYKFYLYGGTATIRAKNTEITGCNNTTDPDNLLGARNG